MAESLLDPPALPCSATLAGRRPAQRRAVSAVAGLAALVVGGCRSIDNAQVDVLERELRQQESYIYELEDYLLEYSEKLRACRCANPNAYSTDDGRVGDKPAQSAPQRRTPLPEPELADDPLPSAPRRESLPPEPEPADPPVELDEEDLPGPAAEEFSPEDIDVPELEVGPTSDARPLPGAMQMVDEDYGDFGPELVIPHPAGYDQPADDGAELLVEEGVAAEPFEQVEAMQSAAAETDTLPLPVAAEGPPGPPSQLAIRHVLRGDAGADGDTQNLFVVVELLDDAGRPVAAAEQTSIMILREDAPGSLQAVERWDFTADEAAAAWQSSTLGDGLHFELPLRGAELPDGPLQVWARTLPAEGEKLLTQITVEAAAAPTLDEALAAALPADAVLPPAAESAAEPRQTAATSGGDWRQTTEPVGPIVEGFATTAGQASGWTSGRGAAAPATTTPHQVTPASASTRSGSSWQRR